MSEMVLIFVALRLVSRRTWNHRWTRTHAPSARARRSDGYAQEGARALCGRAHGQRTMMLTPRRTSPSRLSVRHSAKRKRKGVANSTRRTNPLFHYGTTARWARTRSTDIAPRARVPARRKAAAQRVNILDPIICHATFESALANEWVASFRPDATTTPPLRRRIR
jgi:hypothetical protein